MICFNMLLKRNYLKVKLKLGCVMCQDHYSGGSWVLKTCRFLFLVSMLAKKTRLTKIGPITMKKTSLHEMEFDTMFEICS